MSKQINYLPLNKEKIDTYTLNALKKINKTRLENMNLLEQEDFKQWLLYRDNLKKVNIFINSIKELLKNNNYKIIDDKGFKNMIASILYRHSQ